MLCRLCLLDCEDLIEIFDEQGKHLNINKIIEQHFGLKLKNDDQLSSKICTTCWLEIENFHIFFIDIQRAQEKLNYELKNYYLNITNNNQNNYDNNNYDNDETDQDEDDDENETLFENIIYEKLTENSMDDENSNDFDNDFNEIQLITDNFLDDYNFNNIQISNDNNHIKNHINPDIEIFDEAAPLKQKASSQENRINQRFRRKSFDFDIEKVQDDVVVDDIVVIDLVSPESISIDEDCDDSNDGNAMNFCTADYNNYDLNAEDEYISSSLNRHEKSDITKILQKRTANYITPLPGTTTTEMLDYYDQKISKYIKLNCEMCGSQFTIFTKLKHHFRSVHNIIGYVICCNKKLFSRVQLIEHILKHINPEILKLPKDEPNINNNNNNNNLYENNFIKMCNVCHEFFTNQNSYECHLWEHDNETTTLDKSECQQCGLKFTHRYSLQKHIRSHVVQNNDLVCSICGKKSNSDVSLHRHLKNVHYKERKYQCTLCEKAFKWSINLKEHMAIHTGESLYKCRHCSKTFNASSNLHSHRKKIHPLEWETERRKRLEDENNKRNVSI